MGMETEFQLRYVQLRETVLANSITSVVRAPGLRSPRHLALQKAYL